MSENLFIKKIGSGPTLVMLHGWGMYSGIFASVIPQLAEYFSLVLVDLPGFGQSVLQTEQDYQFDRLINLINKVVAEPAYWLGWSLGGLITAGIAIHYPEKVRGLIQVATSPCFAAKKNWPGITSEVFTQFYHNLVQEYEKTLQHFIALQVFQSQNYKMQLEQIKNILAEVKNPDEVTLCLSFDLLRNIDLRSELPTISCSVLALFGRLDKLVPVQIAEEIKTFLPQVQSVVFPSASHMPFLSHPNEFVNAIIKHVL